MARTVKSVRPSGGGKLKSIPKRNGSYVAGDGHRIMLLHDLMFEFDVKIKSKQHPL